MVFSIMLLSMIGIGIAYTQEIPSPGHGADSVWISVDEIESTLQEAINNDLLLYLPISNATYTQEIPSPGHGADSVWISVDGIESTLQEAILTGTLCGMSTHDYINNVYNHHVANEILISIDGVEMNLQEAIDSSKFCCFEHSDYQCSGTDVYWYDSCGTMEELKESCGAGTCSNGACVAPEPEPEIEYYWKFVTACGLVHGGSVSVTSVCDNSRVGDQVPIVMGPIGNQGDTIIGVGGSGCRLSGGDPYVALYECTIK